MEKEEHMQKYFHRPTMKVLNSCRRLEFAAAEGNRRCQYKEHDRQKRAPLKAAIVVVSVILLHSLGAGGQPCQR